MALASAALLALVLLPRSALSPAQPPPRAAAAFETMALGEQAEPLALLRPPRQVQVAEVRPQRSRPYRPASTIDDAVRQRAYEAVARTLAIGNG